MNASRRPLLALAALLVAGVTVAPSRAADRLADSKFEVWVKQEAKRRGYTLCRIGIIQYESKQASAYFATLTKADKVGHLETIVFSWGKARRAFTTSESDLGEPECPAPRGAPAWERLKELVVGPWGADPTEHYHLSVVDREVVLLSETASDKFIEVGTDWEGLSHADRSADEEERPHGYALLPVLAPGSAWRTRLPRPRTWVTFGESAHLGPADASLDLRLVLAGKAVRFELTATDDIARPLSAATAPDAVFLRADHFELWFCAPAGDQGCEKTTSRQLGVARLADGHLHARWLHPQGNREKLPTVEALATGLAVTIPLGQMSVDGTVEAADETLEGKLTVAYSDSDAEGKGQETIVATSLLRWGEPDSFGLFIRHPDGARFPRWTGSAEYSEDETFASEDEPAPE